MNNGPQRIVCLTEETTETLYLLGEEARIVGISGFTCRPKQAREKPKVSAFTSAKIDKILELRPDLVIGFSDLQAAIAQELIRAGVNVMVFNQRSIDEIFEMMLMLARMVAAEAAGLRLAERLRGELARIAESAGKFPRRPRVFFEEWADPLISGIRWVDELVEVAGGEPVFPRLREQGWRCLASGRCAFPQILGPGFLWSLAETGRSAGRHDVRTLNSFPTPVREFSSVISRPFRNQILTGIISDYYF